MKRFFSAAALILSVLAGLCGEYAGADETCFMVTSERFTLHFEVDSWPDLNDANALDIHHTDIDIPFTSQGWDIMVSHDYPHPDTQILPEDAVIFVNPHAHTTAPVSEKFSFLGVTTQDPNIWILPQNEPSGVLWLGWNTSRSDQNRLCLWTPQDSRAQPSAKWHRVDLTGFSGPENGHFSLWNTLAMGEFRVWMSTYENGIDITDSYYILSPAHSHINWGFTKPGSYDIDFHVSTFYTCDGDLVADISGDCRVTMIDAALFAGNWLDSTCGTCNGADIHTPRDMNVNADDLNVLALQWLDCGYPACESF